MRRSRGWQPPPQLCGQQSVHTAGLQRLLSTKRLTDPFTPSGGADTVPPPCLPRSMGVRSSPAPPAIPWSPAGQLQGRQHVRKTPDRGNAGKTHPAHALGRLVPCCARSRLPPQLHQPWHHRVSTERRGALAAHPKQPRRYLISALTTLPSQGRFLGHHRQHRRRTMPTACGCWN